MKQAGVIVDWILLAKIGIKGNGHFSMLEKNSDQIAGVILKWLLGKE